jgi:hypothetical protein
MAAIRTKGLDLESFRKQTGKWEAGYSPSVRWGALHGLGYSRCMVAKVVHEDESICKALNLTPSVYISRCNSMGYFRARLLESGQEPWDISVCGTHANWLKYVRELHLLTDLHVFEYHPEQASQLTNQ